MYRTGTGHSPGRARRPLAFLLLLVGAIMAMLAVVTVQAAGPPAITMVTPIQGPTAGATGVTILGTGFTGATAVTFGGTPAASFVVANDGQITATTPAHAAGTVVVLVTTPGGTSPVSKAGSFTYVPPAPVPPTVTLVNPASGPAFGGTPVTITGTGFTGATSVTFGGVLAGFAVVNDSTILATSPATIGPSTVFVIVSGPGGSSLPGATFTYLGVLTGPTVSGLSPNFGPTFGGTGVTITGANFVNVTSVTFGGSGASFSVLNANTIVATSPAHTAGSFYVVVTTVTGVSPSLPGAIFTYTGGFGPTVASVSPNSGPSTGGTVVQVTGSGFTGAFAVTFGGVGGSGLVVINDSLLTVVSPPHVPGTVDVQVTTGLGTSAPVFGDQFTFTGGPIITSIVPASGPVNGGTYVTINGSGFIGLLSVTFGGVPALGYSGQSNFQITAIAPPHAAGIVDVRVSTYAGISGITPADLYTYVGGPAIYSVSPVSGPVTGGTVVTITGAGFLGTTSVTFGSIPAAFFSIINDGTITAVAPAGVAGLVDVRVSTTLGTSAPTSAGQFTFTAIAPAATPTASPTATPPPPTPTPTTPPPPPPPPTATPQTGGPAPQVPSTPLPRPSGPAPMPPNTGSGVSPFEQGGLNLAWLFGALVSFAGAGVLMRPRARRA